VVAVLATVHAVVVIILALAKHRNFDTYAFDLGIYDQAWWLVAHHGGGFDTVRGLPIWGHHVNLVLFLLSPLARLGGGTTSLVVIQAAALSAGALPVSWIARARLNSSRMGVVFGVVYLLYPPTSWLSWVSFHPESLSVTPMLFAIWFASQRRWKSMAMFLLLAMSTREEVAIMTAVFGLVLLVRHWRERSGLIVGALTFLVSVTWFGICTKVIIPNSLGGDGAFYVSHFFGKYGNSLGDVASHLLTHPQDGVGAATTPDARRFLIDLLGPLGFLPLFGMPLVALAAPQVASTLLGSQSFLREITNQYTALMVPGFVVGAIDGVARIRRRVPKLKAVAVGWLVLCSLGGALLRGPLPGAGAFSSWRLTAPSNSAAMNQAIRLVPADAGVVASGELVPHLSERRVIYTFPNPFEPLVYGLDDATPRYPQRADWVVVNYRELLPKRQKLVDRLRRSAVWAVVFDRDGVVVLKRR
jgi:uncharacterized membrane protein